MRKIQVAIACAAVVLCVSAFGAAQVSSPGLSRAELKKMIAEANTPDQYNALETYFNSQQLYYQQKAAIEKHEWLQLSRGSFTTNEKYPTPGDAARNRYVFFTEKAQQMRAKASLYEGLSAGAAQ